ncbi:DNA-directed RNA polymerase subunit D [Candidatus Pacearchaeota archaeon CG10_big_fil_rev_8_21_14_0_10_35_219]|nr:DNA-directed RNA polymerase subunit D [Candidatus Pacearchaeota archaeon]OIO42228.1 MAG: hypothetical protein AUJ63_03025 [Candidatus Pacearchaeota archaeon CG1_02_35_32]PIO07302.1 MAG: DNA-directed RNA polymerase subunit D [Candidatus Pacearchaeota archaeon CG10_big_fil_rev_8_21_14_0_10_35_219]PIY81352.1 MAG: DNA-directed RNA polymerase subunit D [Candidatus Pacearchaeota archaeon CG_4_10_14_0_8_um_filter_35_169]PIZ79808.1 MAG: DNA-directed RNA polymerase subunit D [Candidatus Pacearchaeota
MEVIEESPEKLIFRMSANYSLANAIRRSLDEVPVLAFDEVEIFKNDSALYDEVLAHRIGLVPLETNKKMSASTKVDLKLSKKGPCWVYSGDLKGGAKVVYDKMPLTLLEEGQELEFVGTAVLGKGMKHAKYSPGLMYYRDLWEVKSSKKEVEKIIQDSKGVIKPEKKGGGWICDLNETELNDIISLDKEAAVESGEMVVFIESWGQLNAKDILKETISALESNLAEFEKSVK